MSINDQAIAGVILLAIGGVMMAYCSPAKAQEHHMHNGKMADADWYEHGCCSNEDCRIIDPATVTYDAGKRMYFWKSELSGKLHVFHEDSVSPVDYRPRIRMSRDFNTHGCERNTADKPGDAPNWVGYCLYLSNAM